MDSGIFVQCNDAQLLHYVHLFRCALSYGLPGCCPGAGPGAGPGGPVK